MTDSKKEAERRAAQLEAFAGKGRSVKVHESKRIRKVSPLGMRVLVRLRPDTNMSEGGLYLPEGAKQAMSESLLAEVVEVAVARDSDSEDEANISGVPLGSLVLIPKHAGVRVPWDPELRLVDTKEILALVNEIDIV